MLHQIAAYIEQNELLDKNQPILVALSGGVDSMVLLHILHKLDYPIIALHCNFHLRGEESDRDQAFVEEFCKAHQIPIYVAHFKTENYALEHGLSIEMAARELRYEWFHRQRKQYKAQAIAVGHHIDDQAETFLLNLLRGTGPRGLAAMHAKQGYVVRPLLRVSRNNIENYAKEEQIPFVTDSSNLHTQYLRNRIRLQVMPLLREIQPQANTLIARAASHVSQSLPFYEQGIQDAMMKAGFRDNCLYLDIFTQRNSPKILLWEWLSQFGFNASQVSNIYRQLTSNSGRRWESHSHRLLLDREILYLEEKSDLERISCKLAFNNVSTITSTHPDYAHFDAELLHEPLYIRRAQTGDTFVPFGMKGHKLLSDFLTDKKLTRFEKEAQMVLCSGDNIIWVIGQRIDNRFAVNRHTKNILQIKYIHT